MFKNIRTVDFFVYIYIYIYRNRQSRKRFTLKLLKFKLQGYSLAQASFTWSYDFTVFSKKDFLFFV